ncbi:MAG: hypothetical protein WCK56_05460 [Alcaligenaceae bacterium]
MISLLNQPVNKDSNNSDFTVNSYQQLIVLVMKSYQVVDYRSIPWGQRFALWRHDCDYSLNRALALARIEAELGLKATYFINPHCQFYNLLERGQCTVINEIIKLGHDIGLHFDATFYNTQLEEDLHKQVIGEADLIERFVGTRPTAFSFHNPTAFHLDCEADTYGGLVNCYSKRFKTEVPYCSDSNGYWRFRRLFNVLSEALDPCVQILTHPGWWQEFPMPPRQRIFRSIYGRANATMQLYDRGLADGGRENLNGKSQAINFLKSTYPKLFNLTDYLWNSGRIDTLFVELWRLHESQINRLCKAVFRKEWKVAAGEVNAFFENSDLAIDGWRLFGGVFDKSWKQVTGTDEDIYKNLVRMRNQLMHGRSTASTAMLEQGCTSLCRIVESLANWGMSQSIRYDGISHLGTIGIPTYKTADGNLTDRIDDIADDIAGFPVKRWERLKEDMSKTGAGEMALLLTSGQDSPPHLDSN